jgi:hypothetical protein
METWGKGYVDPRIHELGISWRCGQGHAPAALPPGERVPSTH